MSIGLIFRSVDFLYNKKFDATFIKAYNQQTIVNNQLLIHK